MLAETAAQLLDLYRMAEAVKTRVVLQENIEGPDAAKLVYFSCYNQRGERIAACMARELRTLPPAWGSATILEPVDDPHTDALCNTFLRDMGYVGLCEIELKRDTRTGQVTMIEANPRYSVSADFGPHAGVDLAWLHYLDLIGKAVVPVGPNGRFFRHVVLNRDVEAIPQYLRAGLETWGSIIRSYRAPLRFLDVDFRDWRVTARTLNYVVRHILGQIVRTVLPGWKRPN